MFFKVTETCTIDTSDRYTKGEEEVNVYQALDVETLEDYFAEDDLKDYITTHGLDVTIEAITEEEAEALTESFG